MVSTILLFLFCVEIASVPLMGVSSPSEIVVNATEYSVKITSNASEVVTNATNVRTFYETITEYSDNAKEFNDGTSDADYPSTVNPERDKNTHNTTQIESSSKYNFIWKPNESTTSLVSAADPFIEISSQTASEPDSIPSAANLITHVDPAYTVTLELDSSTQDNSLIETTLVDFFSSDTLYVPKSISQNSKSTSLKKLLSISPENGFSIDSHLETVQFSISTVNLVSGTIDEQYTEENLKDESPTVGTTEESSSNEKITEGIILCDKCTTEESSAREYTTEESSTADYTTEENSTADYTTEESSTAVYTTEERSTAEYTTKESSTAEYVTEESSTAEYTTEESSTTEYTTEESSTTENTEVESSTSNNLTTTSGNGINVGLVVGIILAILLIGVGVIFWRAHNTGRLVWPPKNFFSNAQTNSIRPQPLPLQKFPSHCNEMLDVPSKLSHEYQLLATLSIDIYSMESFLAAQSPDNRWKNRYRDILPFDSTRVKLTPDHSEQYYSDYINASYVKGYSNEIEYIATQGPKEETCRDFWRMVYQEPIKLIVMVTQLEEQGKPKCFKYFPDLREHMEMDDIIVRCTTQLDFSIYTSRTLILTKGEKKRSITHLHFREWPDFGCPATPDLMLQFCQVMRHNIVLAQPGITLIHCSAGVGRTGTLIAVDILLQHIKDNKKIDIFGTVYKLRKHRINMVQSEAQYVYIFKCVKEALEDPSYLSSVHRDKECFSQNVSSWDLFKSTKSESSSTTSLEPIYENLECARLTPESSGTASDTTNNENECAL